MEKLKEKTNVNAQKNNDNLTYSSFSIVSFVLGIVSTVLFFIPVTSIPSALLAVIFAALDRKVSSSTMSVAGLVLGLITLGLYVVILITCLIIGSTFPGIANFINQLYTLVS